MQVANGFLWAFFRQYSTQQKKRYKDTLKASLIYSCVDSADWENVVTDCSAWRCKTGSGAPIKKIKSVHDVIRKRSLRKLNLNTASSSSFSQPSLH
jgi:hypothetical protein